MLRRRAELVMRIGPFLSGRAVARNDLSPRPVPLADVGLIQADVAIKLAIDRIRQVRRLSGRLSWQRRDLNTAEGFLRGARLQIDRELQKRYTEQRTGS